MNRTRLVFYLGVGIASAAALGLSGCVGRAVPGEVAARQQVAATAAQLGRERPEVVLSALEVTSTHADALRFAILNSPKVRAAYYDWVRTVERITVERSLPDPQFSLQADISDMIASAMPGLMLELPGPKKLVLAGEMASAEAQVRYQEFLVQVQQVAVVFKRAYYQLYFLDARIAVNRATLELLGDLETIARRQNELGKVTSQDVLRAQIEQDQMRTEIANLDDSRLSLFAQYKASLGLERAAPDPAVPARFETTPLELNPDQIWIAALEQNPRLKVMAADVRAAEAALRLAARSRVPDYSIGLELDVKASPLMARPTFGMSLPIWRDKIAATIAAAQAAKTAGEARLEAEQIMLAVDLAEKTFMLREATRNVTLFEEALLPKAQQSLDVARSAYLTGRIDFFNLLDASRTLLDFELKRIDAKTQRELALADLSYAIAGTPPSGASFGGTAHK